MLIFMSRAQKMFFFSKSHLQLKHFPSAYAGILFFYCEFIFGLPSGAQYAHYNIHHDLNDWLQLFLPLSFRQLATCSPLTGATVCLSFYSYCHFEPHITRWHHHAKYKAKRRRRIAVGYFCFQKEWLLQWSLFLWYIDLYLGWIQTGSRTRLSPAVVSFCRITWAALMFAASWHTAQGNILRADEETQKIPEETLLYMGDCFPQGYIKQGKRVFQQYL